MCWKHLNDTTPKARKEHRCELCGLPIVVGQEHVARRGVFEGEAITQRMHTDCEEVTHGWREDDWENRDEHGFREEKAAFFANAALTGGGNAVPSNGVVGTLNQEDA